MSKDQTVAEQLLDLAHSLDPKDEAQSTLSDTLVDLSREAEQELPDLPHKDGEDCYTYYDGCNCTVETLNHNIRRADAAEAKLKFQGRAISKDDRLTDKELCDMVGHLETGVYHEDSTKAGGDVFRLLAYVRLLQAETADDRALDALREIEREECRCSDLFSFDTGIRCPSCRATETLRAMNAH
jgi:hypothetical protein